MRVLTRLLPDEANNRYEGRILSLYGIILFTLVMTLRSLIHLLLPDGGINSIAHIIKFNGSPDPNAVIYLFASLWGLQQLIFCLVNIVVLFRYRSLIPLMYLFWIIEWAVRLTLLPVLHGLGPEYRTGITPGAAGAPGVLVVLLVLFVLSLRGPKNDNHADR